MGNILDEPFVKQSTRISNYIKKRLSQQQVKKPLVINSHERLGFAGHSYSAKDLAGTNEIANGDVFSANGKHVSLQIK
jgi:hypothetical protein